MKFNGRVLWGECLILDNNYATFKKGKSMYGEKRYRNKGVHG